MQGTLFSVVACLSSVLMRQVYPHIHLLMDTGVLHRLHVVNEAAVTLDCKGHLLLSLYPAAGRWAHGHSEALLGTA
jgi:hypothetical protein